MEPTYILPPHHESVTLTPHRWWVIWNSFIGKRGDLTAGLRAIIWDAIQLAGGADVEEPLTLVFLTPTARMLTKWEAKLPQ